MQQSEVHLEAFGAVRKTYLRHSEGNLKPSSYLEESQQDYGEGTLKRRTTNPPGRVLLRPISTQANVFFLLRQFFLGQVLLGPSLLRPSSTQAQRRGRAEGERPKGWGAKPRKSGRPKGWRPKGWRPEGWGHVRTSSVDDQGGKNNRRHVRTGGVDDEGGKTTGITSAQEVSTTSGAPEGWGPRVVRAQTQKKWEAQRVGARRVGPKISLFSLSPNFASFLLSLGSSR